MQRNYQQQIKTCPTGHTNTHSQHSGKTFALHFLAAVSTVNKFSSTPQLRAKSCTGQAKTIAFLKPNHKEITTIFMLSIITL